MPRNDVARQIGLYADHAAPGCMGGMLNMFDWNSALLGKKLLTDPDFNDGIEAPRNSLDMVSGERGSVETPKASSVKKEDIAFSVKLGKGSVPPAAKDAPKDPPRDSVSLDGNDKRRRSTSVVARLMGLDPLPDANTSQQQQQPPPSNQPQQQQPPTPSNQTPKVSKDKLSLAQRLLKGDVKDIKVIPPEQVIKSSPSDLSTPRLSVGSKAAAVEPTNSKASQQNPDADLLLQLSGGKQEEDLGYPQAAAALSSREHPQEKQLQEFKKQFATKLAMQNHENRQRSHRQLDSYEVEVKRIMVEEKMNEAALLAAAGKGAGGEKNDPKRLAAALDKLNKSKEFQEVLEVLQSNKEFFLKFLQEPNAILLDKNQPPTQDQQPDEEDIMLKTPPQPVEIVKKPTKSKDSSNSNEKKSKGGISPSSFARRFMESRRGNSETKQQRKSHKSSSRSEDESPTPSTSASTPRASFMASLRDSRPLTGDRELTVRTSQLQQQASSYDGSFGKKDPFSPGKIVLLRPGSNDTPEISSPSSLPSFSPRHFRPSKESSKDSKGYAAVESRLTAEQQLYRESVRTCSKDKVGRHSVDSWENYANEEAAAAKQVNKESAKPLRSSSKERERSKESRDIARDIIREARAGIVRELGRAAEVSPRSSSVAGEVTLSRNGSTGRRITLLRMSAAENGEVTGSSDGEATPTSVRGLRSGSTTGISSPASARTARSHDSVFSSFGSGSKLAQQKRRERAALEKEKEAALLAVQLEEQQHHLQQKGLSAPRKSLSSAPFESNRSSSPRRSSAQMSSKVLRKAIVGSLLETQVLTDSRQAQSQQQQQQQQEEAESYPRSSDEKKLLPKLLLKGERVVSNIPSEDESSAVNSPRTLQRCRSVPNAAIRAMLPLPEQPQQQQQQTPQTSRSSSPFNHQRSLEAALAAEASSRPSAVSSGSSKPFADSYKRGVEAVGSLFARAKSKERNRIFARSRKKSQSGESSELSLGTSEDYRHREGSVSNGTSGMASPIEWSGRLNLPVSYEDSETEASEISDMKRISVCSDVGSYELQQQHSSSSSFSRPVVLDQDSIHTSVLSAPRGQVRVNADMATDQCDSPLPTTEHCNSPMAADLNSSLPRDEIVITDVLEVPTAEQTPRSRQFGSLGTEESRNHDDDALEACDRKDGQPSPISVLDSPFEELESPSPKEFKEINSDLQELRLRLRLLKLDENDRPRPSLDSTQESDAGTPQVEQQRCQELMVREAENSDCCQQLEPESLPREAGGLASVAEAAISRDRALLESIDLEGFPCPEDRRDDLVYIRDLLVASEFVQSPAKVFTRWHSPSQPLDPILFENLEDFYNGCQPNVGRKDGRLNDTAAEYVVKLNHRLLFDAVNDVLLKKLGPYMTFHPWVQPSTPLLLRPMPSGRQLVMETWMELCSSFPSSACDVSNSLLQRDLSKGNDWICQRKSLEQIGLELEREILSDLIDETVVSLSLLLS
ncbi:hypothetical protein R1sor_017669 [Riccia sorocarpa]|uniref:DUF4378 domain-containing protein n=1 Tax=Riccia sorocarpa TaxID=122646 RepID=A0ABD3I7L1_9MARC